MSDQQTDTQTSSNNKSQQRKKGLSIFILLLLLIAIGSAAYWFFFVKGFEETEDAYVSGNQVKWSHHKLREIFRKLMSIIWIPYKRATCYWNWMTPMPN